jgi:hypothetical protein
MSGTASWPLPSRVGRGAGAHGARGAKKVRPGEGRGAQQKCWGRTFDEDSVHSKSTEFEPETYSLWFEPETYSRTRDIMRNRLAPATTEKLLFQSESSGSSSS